MSAPSSPSACPLKPTATTTTTLACRTAPFPSSSSAETATSSRPPAQLAQVAASAADPKRLVLLPGADHFFTGHLAAMQSSLAGWLKEQLS